MTRALLLTSVPAVVLVGLVRPYALVAIVLIGAFAGAVARTGLWLVDDLVRGDPDALAVRVGLGASGLSAAVATTLLLLGPASVPVLAAAAMAPAALLLRPGRPAGWLR